MKDATPERYRLVDCSQLTECGTLCIDEFDHFPHISYTAVSYVWRGNDVPKSYTAEEFSVVGAEEADPIGVDVLRDACLAALARGTSYLWIDRLCIMQTNKNDKNWQIREMYHMYHSCASCIVVPGGLRRLVPLDEETGWIHRGWTLQEAIAPHSVSVLFSWKLGKCRVRTGDSDVKDLEEVAPNQSAMTSLSFLLDACTTGHLVIDYGDDKSRMVQAKLFSAQPFNHTYNDIPFWQPTRRIMSPNVSALAISMSDYMSLDEKQYAIWQSALMRTSSRPVDMVFSIMGLFGVSLDTRAFHKNDRIGATIALAQQILRNGGRANWLGVSFRVTPCPNISTFPTFPRTRVSGKALVRIADGKYREVSELMENEYPIAGVLGPMPQGSMDEDGYLTFNAKAMRLIPASGNSAAVRSSPAPPVGQLDNTKRPASIRAVNGSTWTVYEGVEAKSNSFAVLLGYFAEYFPGATAAPNGKNVRALLIEHHAPGKFHITSYFMLSQELTPYIREWKQYTFCVGGPDVRKGEDAFENQDVHEVTVVDHELLKNSPASKRAPTTLREMTERKARWAIPQNVMEKYSKSG